MPNETEKTNIPEGVEIAENVISKGEVKFMTRTALSNPAPEKMKRIIKALNYFCVGIMGTVAGTDLFSGRQVKIIVFVVACFVIGIGSLEIVFGVKPAEEKE